MDTTPRRFGLLGGVALTIASSSSGTVHGQDAIDFGWGDVLSDDAVMVRRQVERALELELEDAAGVEVPCVGDLDGDREVNGSDLGRLLAVWGTTNPIGDLDGDGAVGGGDLGIMLASWGPCDPPGVAFAFPRPGGGVIRVLASEDGRFERDGLSVRRLDLLGQPPAVEAVGRIFVTRPRDLNGGRDTHVDVLSELIREDVEIPASGVAYGMAPTDLPVGDLPGVASTRFQPIETEHRVQRTLLRPDLLGFNRDYAAGTLAPQGVAGVSVAIIDDDAYDVPEFDLDRGYALLQWNESIHAHGWLGFSIRLTEAGSVDLSNAEAHLNFSVAGGVEGPCLHVVLEDVHVDGDGLGNEAHLSIQLEEINASEQAVSIPLAAFQAANPSLDLTRLVHLKFAARDDNIPGAGYCPTGAIAIFDPIFHQPSPERFTAPNVFWTNDTSRADAGSGNPLSTTFFGQPVSAFKYFDGVAGTEAWRAYDVIGRCSQIRAAGLVPHVTLELWLEDGRNPLDVLATGEYDDFFRTLFDGLRDLGGRVELTPLHESNGWWYPWSSFGSPWKVSNGFRRIADLRRDAGAHNVALGYCLISIPGDPASLREGLSSIAPDAVDFIGLQGFEQGYGWDTVTFNELFSVPGEIIPEATGLPIMISEYGFNPQANAQHSKGRLASWALGDIADLRLRHAPTTVHYFNVAKFEDDRWKDFRMADEATGGPVVELLDWDAEIRARLSSVPWRSQELGRTAYEAGLRRHSSTAYRVRRDVQPRTGGGVDFPRASSPRLDRSR